MIVRMWRGIVRSELLDEYAEIVERTGLAESRQTQGNRGAQLLTRDLGEGRSELITLSWWDSLVARSMGKLFNHRHGATIGYLSRQHELQPLPGLMGDGGQNSQ